MENQNDGLVTVEAKTAESEAGNFSLPKKMNAVELLDDDAVKIRSGNDTFYVQTVDFQYRYSLGCLVLDVDGQDVDDQELVSELVKCAEGYLQERFVCDYVEDSEGFVVFRDKIGYDSRKVKLNDCYLNKNASAYERRFESSESFEE